MNLSGALKSAYDRAVKSTVLIGAGGSFGTGFVVAAGLIVTNSHVAVAPKMGVRFADSTEASATVIARNPSQDLALLSCETADKYPLILAKSQSLELGDLVFAIGNPLGLENAWSLGIVSGMDSRDESLLHLDISLAPGNSGGPVFNAAGGVIGVASMIASPGIGLAIRSESVEGLLKNATAFRAA